MHVLYSKTTEQWTFEKRISMYSIQSSCSRLTLARHMLNLRKGTTSVQWTRGLPLMQGRRSLFGRCGGCRTKVLATMDQSFTSAVSANTYRNRPHPLFNVARKVGVAWGRGYIAMYQSASLDPGPLSYVRIR